MKYEVIIRDGFFYHCEDVNKVIKYLETAYGFKDIRLDPTFDKTKNLYSFKKNKYSLDHLIIKKVG